MSRYLLDANVFIEAKNRYYGFDICPGFWDWLVEQNDAGSVASIKKVADELKAGDDELVAWAKRRGPSFFLNPDEKVAAALKTVSAWAEKASYTPKAIADFLGGADYWLVAHALAHECVVVTHEIPSNSSKKIKIPDACRHFGLSFVSPYNMLRQEGAKFVLEN